MLPRIPWDATPATMKQFAPGVWDPDTDRAELYYLPDDFSQARDLAAEHPEKVAELRELFWEEAEKYLVLPLLGGSRRSSASCRRSASAPPTPTTARCRTSPPG